MTTLIQKGVRRIVLHSCIRAVETARSYAKRAEARCGTIERASARLGKSDTEFIRWPWWGAKQHVAPFRRRKLEMYSLLKNGEKSVQLIRCDALQ